MTQPGRKFTQGSSGYKYSINGQEKSDELNENLTTALYWVYDSRIGRRWNLDPKLNEYESPYLCFSGNPINMVDPDGDETPIEADSMAEAAVKARAVLSAQAGSQTSPAHDTEEED